MAKTLQIYNLQFPPYVDEIKIGDYLFKRASNYEEAFNGMMCLVESYGSEFNTKLTVGTNQITATVELPKKEKKASLPFGDKKLKQLDDILFLLTILTDYNVFKKDWKENKNTIVIQDHRIHHYGGQLALSLSHDWVFKNRDTGEIKTESQIGKEPIFDWEKINIGFEKSLNTVLKTISSNEWQNEYNGGYFLFLFKSAIQRQIIETSFILCWTIWEHIFALKNKKWLDDTSIEQMSGDKKIAYILNTYFFKDIDGVGWKNIKRINKTRNRLIHFGIKTDEVDFEEMGMFVRLTEQLIAIILKLSPSNVFNSFESLDKFLKKTKSK